MNWRQLLGLWALGTVLAAGAGVPIPRAELERQRQEVHRRFERELQACQLRFAVTACVNEARERRQVADTPLREGLLQLDTQLRRQRADERRRVVADKQREAAVQRRARAAPAASDAGR